jgi:opine dehydrogenase
LEIRPQSGGEMNNMKVAVLGGGNASHTIAADLTLKGLTVNMFEMEQYAGSMRSVFETRQIEMSGVAGSGVAHLNNVTSDIRSAVQDAEVIFIPLPGFTVSPYARLLAPILRADQIVLLLPGSLGALEFKTALQKHGNTEDVIVAEAGGLPFATRLVAPGKVITYHIRAMCGLAAVPGNAGQSVYDKVKDLYHFELKETVVETGLGHLTPLLHPAGTLLNAGRIERSHGDFYMYEEGMTPSVVKVVEVLDLERLKIGESLGVRLPTGVDMMVESGYGPRGTLWESINGSAGLTPVKGPVSLQNRYVTEDVPFGLVAWASFGDVVGVETPIMDALIAIGGAIMGVDPWTTGRNLEKMGLSGLDRDNLMSFLLSGRRL